MTERNLLVPDDHRQFILSVAQKMPTLPEVGRREAEKHLTYLAQKAGLTVADLTAGTPFEVEPQVMLDTITNIDAVLATFAPQQAPERQRLIVHLGFHKAGSTFLQSSLLASARAAAGDLRFLPGGIAATQAVSSLATQKLLRTLKDRGDTSAAFQDLRHCLAEARGHIILSNENLLGDQLGQNTGDLYPLAPEVVRAFDVLSDAYDIEYVFYVRRQDEFIESTYLNLVRDGMLVDFQSYFDRLVLPTLAFNDFFCRLADATPNPIRVIPFEVVKRSPALFLDSLSTIAAPNLHLVPGRNTRPSFSEVALQLAMLGYPHLSGQDRLAFGDFLAARFSTRTNPRAPLLSDEQRRGIIEMFRDDNAKLFSTWIAPEYQEEAAYYRSSS
jgi:hypothetical protein